MDFTLPDYLSLECKDLILKLMKRDKDERLTLDEILVHPWI